MRYAIAAAALAGVAFASPAPVATATGASSSCSATYNNGAIFELQPVNVTTKRSIQERAEPLMVTLNGGILKDTHGRIGYIASNTQFQFDYQAQPGSSYDAGWAVCPNNTLVLGSTAVFQQCLSGGFYNLYDGNKAAQCNQIYIDVVQTGGTDQFPDGQVTASAVASQISDGQVQATSAAVITQITDGQIQAPTSTKGGVITQITDGQIQAPTSAMSPIQQITDGQIQAPTAKPTTTGAVVTQISDGQIQAPTNGTKPSMPTSVQAYTGAASLPTAAVEMMVAAGALVAALL